LIEDTLRALLALDHPKMDILIVDQSTDDVSRETVRHVAGGDSRVRVHSSKTVGVAANRNLGAKLSTGELVAYTDDDCIVTAGWLEALEDELRDPRVGAVYGRVLPYEARMGETTRGGKRIGTEAGYKPTLERAEYNKPAPPWYIGHGANMAFRRTVLMEVGAFDPLLGTGGVLDSAEDIDLTYRLLASSKRVIYAPAALVYHKEWKDWPSRRSMERAYGLGAGAMTAKYVRCGDMYGLNLFATWIWQLGVRRVGAGLLKWRSYKVVQLGCLQLVYPWLGVVKSLRYPVDRRRTLYVEDR
jgi:GT2 family glycosyltransferase